MKPWIKKCTEGRQTAVENKDLLKKKFFKLVVNSQFPSKLTLFYFACFFSGVFGKTIEKQESQRKFQLVNNAEDALEYTNDPRLVKAKLITKDLLLFELKKKTVILDKPLYIGQHYLIR